MVRLASFAVSVDTAPAAGAGAGEVNLIVGAEAAASGAAGADGAAVGLSFRVGAAAPGAVGFNLIVLFGMAEAGLFSLLSVMIVILLHNVIFFTFSHSCCEYNMRTTDSQVIK